MNNKFVSPPYELYVGDDKHESRFHVDKLSSAHVYLRLHEGESIEDVPEAVIQDCAQLVKVNSIQGNKMNNIDVVYTMWDNLKKTAGMDVGQVGFHKQKEVKTIRVGKLLNEIVNRLNKTKREEKTPDLRGRREERDRRLRENEKVVQREQRKQEKEEQQRKAREAEERSYDKLMTSDRMTSNQDAGNDSDDFM